MYGANRCSCAQGMHWMEHGRDLQSFVRWDGLDMGTWRVVLLKGMHESCGDDVFLRDQQCIVACFLREEKKNEEL